MPSHNHLTNTRQEPFPSVSFHPSSNPYPTGQETTHNFSLPQPPSYGLPSNGASFRASQQPSSTVSTTGDMPFTNQGSLPNNNFAVPIDSNLKNSVRTMIIQNQFVEFSAILADTGCGEYRDCEY